MKVFLIGGARPNFMKVAPIYREATKRKQVQCHIVHTGQHYDYEMSQAFFEDLEIPEPNFFWKLAQGAMQFRPPKSWWLLKIFAGKKAPTLLLWWVM